MTQNKEIYSYAGKILRVDLTSGAYFTESTMGYARKWLGANGINQWSLYKELKPWVTPYEPANRIIIGAGPLVGTLAPAATRLSIASKNVFSHGVGSSNCCGHFASELKYAGYDHIVLQGRSARPVYLWIDDDSVQLKDAGGIWGETTWEADDLIKKEIGDDDIQIICIGPAGENLVRGACLIANRNRAAGKCGLGAVMGSKNLKAIAVKGTGYVQVADPDRFMQVVNDARQTMEKSLQVRQFGQYGTFAGLPSKNERCSTAYKNFQVGHIPPESIKRLEPDIFLRYKKKSMGYMACPISCSSYFKVNHGPYAGLGTEGFELEDCVNFAGRLAIDYPPAIIMGHALCNQLGLDLDNGLGPISWAFECYQRGILTEKDTDGLKLEWGDYGVVFELLRKTAYREGFGNILAEGSKRASEMIGRDSAYYAISMKGQDLYEEIRLAIGWGLGACVATRGGGHTTGSPGSLYEPGETIDPLVAELIQKVCGVELLDQAAYENKPKLVLYFERLNGLMNALGLCIFVGAWLHPTFMSFPELAELYSAATGWEVTQEELVKTADRILNVEKAFNALHANLDRRDDYPPDRFLKEPIGDGPYKGFALSKEKYDSLLDEYYTLHGWDVETGLQTKKCLLDLDLADVATDLERANKLIEI